MKKELQGIDIWKNPPQGISFEEEVDLLERYHKYGDQEAFNTLVLGSLRLVRKYVHAMSDQVLYCQSPVYPDMDDLLSEGVMALFDCINYYNVSEKKYRFSTYLFHKVYGKLSQLKRKSSSNDDISLYDSGRHDLAHQDNQDLELIGAIPDKTITIEGIDEEVEIGFIKDVILPCLTKKERDLFVACMLEGQTYEEAGLIYGIVGERVRQVLDTAMEKVKRIYKEGMSEEDYVLRGVQLTKHTKQQALLSARLIKTYGRSFLVNTVIPSLKSAQKRKFAMEGIIRYAGQSFTELNAQTKMREFLQSGFEKYVKDFVAAQAIEKPVVKKPRKQKPKITQARAKRMENNAQLIRQKGGELVLRRFFMPTLPPLLRQVFDATVIEYEGEKLLDVAKQAGINPTDIGRNYHIVFERCKKFDTSPYIAKLTSEMIAQENYIQSLFERFGRKNIAQLAQELDRNHRALVMKYILKYDGEKLSTIALRCNIPVEQARQFIQNLDLRLSPLVKPEPSAQPEQPAVKLPNQMPEIRKEVAQKFARYKRLAGVKGGELFLRKYFLPYLPEGQREVFQAGVLEYDGQHPSALAQDLGLSTVKFNKLLDQSIEALQGADFDILVSKIDYGNGNIPTQGEMAQASLRKKLIEENGGCIKVRKFFLPILSKEERAVFEQLYLSPDYPTHQQTANALQLDLAQVYSIDKIAVQKLCQTNLEELRIVHESAKKQLPPKQPQPAKKSERSRAAERAALADHFGGAEYCRQVIAPIFHVPIDRQIFEQHVIEGKSFKEMAKSMSITGKDPLRYLTGRWAGYVKDRAQAFVDSFDDFDRELREFYSRAIFDQLYDQQSVQEAAFALDEDDEA